MLPPLTNDRRAPDRVQLEALIWALEFDIACLRVRHEKNAKGIAVLRARVEELQKELTCLAPTTVPPVTKS